MRVAVVLCVFLAGAVSFAKPKPASQPASAPASQEAHVVPAAISKEYVTELFKQPFSCAVIVALRARLDAGALREHMAGKRTAIHMVQVIGVDAFTKKPVLADERRRTRALVDVYANTAYEAASNFVLDTKTGDAPLEREQRAESLLTCLGKFGDAPALAVKARERRVKVETAVEEERRCEADPKCFGERIVDRICNYQGQKREVERQISLEHRYSRKARVVNLRALQDLKEQLRLWDEKLAEAKTEHRARLRKSFSGKCR